MRYYVIFIFLFVLTSTLAQDSLNVYTDTKYREDQFYASITYNALHDKPAGISSTDFSTGFHFGFIRDIPINDKRNLAIGLGLGLSTNSYNQNLAITQSASMLDFNNADNILNNITTNKFTTYLIDLPIEFRWRTSTPTDYKFWRIYSGLKFSYLLYNSTRLESDNFNQKLSNIEAFNNLQYGITLSAGYGTFNFHVYYGLNPIFEDTSNFNGKTIDLKAIKFGLMFYIL